MANWEFEHSAESKAPPADVWGRYTDVELWPEWSNGVEKASLEGEFEAGGKGTIKSPSLPSSKFELVEVDAERSFVSKTKLPGASMSLAHTLEPANGGTRITHRATIEGPLQPLWSRAVGWVVRRDIPKSVERLAELTVEKAKMEAEQAKREKERDARLKEADEKFREEIEKTSHGEGDAGGASLPGR